MAEDPHHPVRMTKYLMFGIECESPTSWVRWIKHLASTPRQNVDRAFARLAAGEIKRHDDPTFLDYWEAQEDRHWFLMEKPSYGS